MSSSGSSIGQTVQFPDLRSPEQLSSGWRQVPRLTRDALRVAWQASRRELLLALVLQGCAGAAMTLQLLAARHVLFELLTLNENVHSTVGLIPSFAILIGAMVVMGVTTALAEQRQRLLAELVAQHALRQIIGVSTRVELAAFENPDFHDQLERARGSAITRSVQMVMAVSGVTTNLLTSAGVAFALLLMEPLLVPLIMVAAIPLLLATVRNSRHAYTFEWAMTPENRERTYLMELLTRREAATEIRVFGATSFLRSRYDRLSAERLRRMREFLRRRLATALAGSVATSIGLGLALVALAALISSGRIEVATALTAGAAMQRLSTSLFAAMSAIGQLVESGMFVDDYNSFVRLLPAAEDEESGEGHGPPDAAEQPRARFNGVRVEGVSFRYPAVERQALKDVSIEIEPGEVVALVGENGSGKTTLVKLICQLYEPEAGRIAWAGAGGGTVEPAAVRGDTTVIFQDFLHYYLTAADNISLGRVEREPTPEAIRAAAQRAGAHHFLDSLPEGYGTRLGRQFQDGHDLSIGQWQRLSLARAFFRGGGFLVLDEPTAALDPKAEYALFQEMRKLWRGRSVLLVSHRFSSVRSADRIYVLHQGEMIEEGSHAALMAADGHYAELFSLQAAAYLDQPEEISSGHKNGLPLGVSRT
jgi:ATP-binding cassette subfamily B protein